MRHSICHAVFGAYLKTVVICSARRTVTPKTSQFHPLVDEADGSNYINAYVKTKRFARQMERVFANIKSRSGSATIGIYDNPGEGDLSQIFGTVGSKHMPCFGWAQLVDQSSTYIAYRTVETFEQTVFAARRARCPVKCLKMELFSLHHDSLSSNLDEAIQRVLESSPATGTPLCLDLGGSRSSHLLYHSESRCVELDSVFLHYDQLSGSIGVPLNGVHAWLTTQRINRLKVSRIDSYIPSALQAYFTPHLSSLELDTVFINTECFDVNFWSEHIHTFSGLSGLKYCKLDSLSYSFVLLDDDDEIPYLEIPGYGRYQWSLPEFYLYFRDGKFSRDLSGDNVCEELKELAGYVAAAEAEKLRQIVGDGYVDGAIVGIFDKTPDPSDTNEDDTGDSQYLGQEQ